MITLERIEELIRANVWPTWDEEVEGIEDAAQAVFNEIEGVSDPDLVTVEYSHNNSGGSDWLKPQDWINLQKAGWEIGRYGQEWTPGERAYGATKKFKSEALGIAEWEYITGQDSEAKGCSCCGRPHYFSTVEGH